MALLKCAIHFFLQTTNGGPYLMDDLIFRSFNEATHVAIPTVVGLEADGKEFCIGSKAKEVAGLGRPVVQDFKRHIGDTDAMFTGSRSEALWPIRPGVPGRQGSLSTEEATQVFFEGLIQKTGPMPKQLVIGTPASTDDDWQKNYKSHVSKVLTGMGFADPKFFPEPFAVFQYYRHCEKSIPDVDHAQTIVVIDIGGGTFDCCGIQTTTRGNLARKGSTAIPLGIKSTQFAGKDIDRRLFEVALRKIKDPLLKKESQSARLQAHPLALFEVEQMKIELSNLLHHQNKTLSEDCSEVSVSKVIARGIYHPDLALSLDITGEDLKTVILNVWKDYWGPTLLSTLSDIKYRGGRVAIDTIDKVILAGGSSHLAFVQQLVAKTLAGQILFNPADIVVGQHFDKAVAYGLAIEAREQRNTSLRTHDSIGPCIFNPLYLYVANERTSALLAPTIRLKTDFTERSDGALLAGPMQVPDFSLDFEITLPFKPAKYFVYKFFDSSCLDHANNVIPLNLEDDVVRVPTNCPSRCSLTLYFGEDGVVRPQFLFGDNPIPVRDFFFGGLQIAREVESYAGVDFGTSNSYVVNLWSESVSRDVDYPFFAISESAGNQLRLLEARIKKYQTDNLLTPSTVKALAQKQRTSFIFNSIKIEGSGLTKGETELALSGTIPIATKELREPINVANGYDFIMENASSYRQSPELFLRELNKIVLLGISDNAGKYRVDSVKLAGMDFEPPPAIAVGPYMERLGNELRDGPGAKSAIHFAAEAHAKLTAIHPFEDGNGRAARLLANAILVEAGLYPITVEFADKERYLDCLKASNVKDLSPMCALFSELMEELLDDLDPATTATTADMPALPQEVVSVSASQRLAETVRRKVAALHIEREARYRAWSAAYDSFREELLAAASAFNETNRLSPFSIKVTMFDTLPLEKYEGIIRGARTPKTWLTGCEFKGEAKRESFMFFFQGMSHHLVTTARRDRVVLAPKDVSLAISRWADGVFRRLLDEPMALREIAYADGQFVFLLAPAPGKWQVTISPMSEMINAFFADVLEAFF